jgi:hypothetical protein
MVYSEGGVLFFFFFKWGRGWGTLFFFKKNQWMTAEVSIGVFWKWTFLGGFEREGVGGEGAFIGHFW